MRANARLGAVVLFVALVLVGCGSPPTADVDGARAALDSANAAHADQYAADSLKAAEDARAALDAELKAQDGAWFKSYDKARELAAAVKTAADKAVADATAAKERADAMAAKQAADAAKVKAMMMDAVHVGGRIKEPTKTRDVKPIYPAAAQAAHAAGPVTVEATIGPDGKVMDARVVRSIPLLDQAALDAVRQWEYAPTMVRGKAVPVVVTVRINFTQQ